MAKTKRSKQNESECLRSSQITKRQTDLSLFTNLPLSYCTFSFLSLSIKLPESATKLAQENDFDIKGYRFTARPEQLRQARVVRVGAIQNSIVLPTTAPIEKQREAIWNKLKLMIKAAAQAGCNIVCTQEAWSECPPDG